MCLCCVIDRLIILLCYFIMGEVVVVVGGEGRRRCSCFCSYFVVHILVLLLCLDALFHLDGGYLFGYCVFC